MIKELLKLDFGLDLDIAGGTGKTRNDPIHVLSRSEQDASRTEVFVLRGLGKGREILWRTVNVEFVPGMKVIQRKIATKEIRETEIVSQIENYYFLRKNIESHSTNINGQNIVFFDNQIGIEFPYELSWLHYDNFTDYSAQGREDLGYSLTYNAPGIKVSIYVYSEIVRNTQKDILELELEAAKEDIKIIYGADEIEHEWEPRKDYDHISYFYISKHAPEKTSTIIIMRKRGYFVKLRCTFTDEPFMREMFSDFMESFISLIREKNT